ncbi:MAG: hypothetical protein SAJ37_00435, partial [Oscillatoria sp. PMC 1068.18]|nr:hypothetical protein [Oscillatoria sp. PMC 1068.18]
MLAVYKKKRVRAVLSWLLTVVLTWGLISCGDRIESSKSLDTQPVSSATEEKLTEVAPPEVIQQLERKLDQYRPQVSILSPGVNQVLPDTSVEVKLQVRDLPVFKSELGIGPHLTLILDNDIYQEIYDVNESIVLDDVEPGTHTLQVFASRPWHESFKNEGAYAQTTFHILTKTGNNVPNSSVPLLTYSRPLGNYGAEPILLDFYLTNAPLHLVAVENPEDEIADWRIRVTVNGQSFLMDTWQPVYLKGFKPGKNWVQIEFLDEQGQVVNNATFNNTVKLISYEPNGEDSLSRLIRGEIPTAIAQSIVDPNYQPEPVPSLDEVPEAVPETIEEPTSEPTESVIPPASESLPAPIVTPETSAESKTEPEVIPPTLVTPETPTPPTITEPETEPTEKVIPPASEPLPVPIVTPETSAESKTEPEVISPTLVTPETLTQPTITEPENEPTEKVIPPASEPLPAPIVTPETFTDSKTEPETEPTDEVISPASEPLPAPIVTPETFTDSKTEPTDEVISPASEPLPVPIVTPETFTDSKTEPEVISPTLVTPETLTQPTITEPENEPTEKVIPPASEPLPAPIVTPETFTDSKTEKSKKGFLGWLRQLFPKTPTSSSLENLQSPSGEKTLAPEIAPVSPQQETEAIEKSGTNSAIPSEVKSTTSELEDVVPTSLPVAKPETPVLPKQTTEV